MGEDKDGAHREQGIKARLRLCLPPDEYPAFTESFGLGTNASIEYAAGANWTGSFANPRIPFSDDAITHSVAVSKWRSRQLFGVRRLSIVFFRLSLPLRNARALARRRNATDAILLLFLGLLGGVDRWSAIFGLAAGSRLASSYPTLAWPVLLVSGVTVAPVWPPGSGPCSQSGTLVVPEHSNSRSDSALLLGRDTCEREH